MEDDKLRRLIAESIHKGWVSYGQFDIDTATDGLLELFKEHSTNSPLYNSGDALLLDGKLEVEVITSESKVLVRDGRDDTLMWVDRNRLKAVESPFNLTREELIKLCEDSVVHHSKWRNRDSYSAQVGIQSVYKALTAGLDFIILTEDISPDYHSDDNTLIIEFTQPIDLRKLEMGRNLEISSREDYFRDCDPERNNEMFDADGIDFHSDHTFTYMPTRKWLDKRAGNDWY